MMNPFVKNGRVRKFWLTKITGPLPEVIPNILVRRTHRNFRNLWANICGFHVSMHCSMESEVMKCFPLFFLLLSIKHAFELPEFGTVAASKVNGSVVTAWHFIDS